MKIKTYWCNFNLNSTRIILNSDDKPHLYGKTRTCDIVIYAMIDDDILYGKVQSANHSYIIDHLIPELNQYSSVVYCNGFNSMVTILPYFKITDPNEIVQFRLTYL